MYLNPRPSRNGRRNTQPDDDQHEDAIAVLENSIAAIERQKGMVQEAIETRPSSLTSLRGLVGNRTSWLLNGTDEGVTVRETYPAVAAIVVSS